MASNWPTSNDNFATNWANATAMVNIHPASHNDMGDFLNKLQTELGGAVKGAFASLAARLTDLTSKDTAMDVRITALERITIDAKTATPYTLVLTDAGKAINMNLAGANTLQIPTDANVNFPIGTQIVVYQGGAGQTTIAAVTPGTTTVHSRGDVFKLTAQYGLATLLKVGANFWVVSGDITA